MNDAHAQELQGDEPARAASRSSVNGRGVVHAFVELAELRRIMGRLAAIEVLRLMLDPAAGA
jgi:hypothetical protein